MPYVTFLRPVHSFLGWHQLLQYYYQGPLKNPSQSAFFRLKRLLNVVGCATITGFTLTHIGRCCVGGIGLRTDFSHIFEMFDYANMRSGLYPFFHIALLNDFGSFALCMNDKLFDSAHSSTAFPSLSVEV